jgi:hypothetical protein
MLPLEIGDKMKQNKVNSDADVVRCAEILALRTEFSVVLPTIVLPRSLSDDRFDNGRDSGDGNRPFAGLRWHEGFGDI